MIGLLLLALPAGVEELAPDRSLRRRIFFHDLRINIDIDDDHFRLS